MVSRMLSDGVILRDGRQQVLDEISETLKEGAVTFVTRELTARTFK